MASIEGDGWKNGIAIAGTGLTFLFTTDFGINLSQVICSTFGFNSGYFYLAVAAGGFTFGMCIDDKRRVKIGDKEDRIYRLLGYGCLDWIDGDFNP